MDDPNDEPVDELTEPEEMKPALVINIHSWATPIAGLVMLVVGLLAGYFLRPLIPLPSGAATPVAAAATPTTASDNPAAASAVTEQPANLQELMAYLLPQVRHFKGDPAAPVTIIEFSDFQ
jgi:hypothetical protein